MTYRHQLLSSRGVLALALSSLFVAGSKAQSCAYPSGSDARTGTSSTLPFGDATQTSHYIQFLVPASRIASTKRRIVALGFAPAASKTRAMTNFSIVLRQSKQTALSTDRLANVSGFSSTAQFDRVDWAVTGNAWNRMPIQFPFDPANGQLLVEIFCGGASAHGSGDLGFRSDPSLDALTSSGWGFQPPRLGTLRRGAPKLEICFDQAFTTIFENAGCKASTGKVPQLSFSGTPKIGQTLDVALRDAPPSGLAVLVWGFRRTADLDLTPAGAPGCFLRMRLDFLFGLATNNGSARVPFVIPRDTSLVQIDPLGFQFFAYDPLQNALQFVSSNWGLAQIGS